MDGDESEDDKEKRSLKEKAKLAEGFWMNYYIRDNNTVIASSFQGMYKSTVSFNRRDLLLVVVGALPDVCGVQRIK